MNSASPEIVAGRYRIVRLVGEGGMARVFEAIDLRTNEHVALKLLHESPEVDSAARLAREAQVIVALNHPNVVRVREAITDASGRPGLVMDLLSGETLGARIVRERGLPIGTTARILLHVISAVGSAHQRGIIHRDLKPDNVFLVNGEDARVLDFGVAKITVKGTLAAATSGKLTATGFAVGTPYYMSPEQVFGEKGIDARADVWSLGIVLYECLAGRRPFEGASIGHVLQAISRGSFTPLRDLAPQAPPEIAELAHRMMTIDREQRPRDLRDAYAVLRRYTEADARAFAAPTAKPED